jgi:hypothetical protein
MRRRGITPVSCCVAGTDEARQRRTERRRPHHTYLVRSNLLQNPSTATLWRTLYHALESFHYTLDAGFATQTLSLEVTYLQWQINKRYSYLAIS